MKPTINFKKFKGGPKSFLFFAAFFAISVLVLTQLTEYSRNTRAMSYSTFLKSVELGQVKAVHLVGQKAYGVLKDGRSRFETVLGDNPKNWDLLREHNVEISLAEPSSSFKIWHILTFLPFLLLIPLGIWYFVRQGRNNNSGGSGIFSMGKSKARM
ncbi:MAG TPA: ATP-dependent metallopeptidase FtsH/Yme1/Tma family protein, partial [Candidatus Babeliaceae bacterium]|nr:ATP-dependent metallopeptidase FtsH/Yme1/Tma family protein [Candidatus Babeliaceae bacterium]